MSHTYTPCFLSPAVSHTFDFLIQTGYTFNEPNNYGNARYSSNQMKKNIYKNKTTDDPVGTYWGDGYTMVKLTKIIIYLLHK